jgi:hypothetical protein
LPVVLQRLHSWPDEVRGTRLFWILFADLLAPDHISHELSVDVPVATPKNGAEGASEWATGRLKVITDLMATGDPVIAEGDLVSAMMTWAGKDADTGADVTWNNAGVLRIQGGKFAENWLVADTLGRLVTSEEITEEELATVTAEAAPVL